MKQNFSVRSAFKERRGALATCLIMITALVLLIMPFSGMLFQTNMTSMSAQRIQQIISEQLAICWQFPLPPSTADGLIRINVDEAAAAAAIRQRILQKIPAAFSARFSLGLVSFSRQILRKIPDNGLYSIPEVTVTATFMDHFGQAVPIRQSLLLIASAGWSLP